MKNYSEQLNIEIKNCRSCPRLIDYIDHIASKKRKQFINDDYWGKPVENFGDPTAKLLIVGLAPAAHGANRTGRMFTGDRSGDWLFRALHKADFANQASSVSTDDQLELRDCFITAVCHCAPPENKPTKEEIANCRIWLDKTIEIIKPKVFLVLGKLAWDQIVSYLKENQLLDKKTVHFAHLQTVALKDGRYLLASYHPSQQNTFTGKLTEPMFDQIFKKAQELLEEIEHDC